MLQAFHRFAYLVLAIAFGFAALASVAGVAAQGTGAVEGKLQVTGREGQVIGHIPILIVPTSDAARTLPEEEFKARAITTDELGYFKKDGLSPGRYLVGILLAPQVLVGSFEGRIYVETSLSKEPIFLPAREVEVTEGKTARVQFVQKPYPTPVPGARVPHTGGGAADVGAESDANGGLETSVIDQKEAVAVPGTADQGSDGSASGAGLARDWFLVGGAALILLGLGAGGAGVVHRKRHSDNSR